MTKRSHPSSVDTRDERVGHSVGNLMMALYPIFVAGLASGMVMREEPWDSLGAAAGICWPILILVALALCWRPPRWTVRTRWRRFRVQAHSAPDWLGVQAAVASILSLFSFLPAKGGGTAFGPPAHLAGLVLSLVALWLAHVCYSRGKSSGRGALRYAYSELFTGRKV